VQISVMSLAFERAVANGQMSHEDVIRCCKEGGADSFEPSIIFLDGVLEKVKDLLAEYGLGVSCFDVRVKLTDPDPGVRAGQPDELVRWAEIAKGFGATGLMVIPGSLSDGITFEQALPWVAAGIREALPRANELGIDLMVEQMGYAAAMCRRPEHLRALLAAVDRPEFCLCYDGGNFTISGQDALTPLPEFLPRVHHAHLKDGVRGDNGWKHTVLGEGIVPVKELVQMLLRGSKLTCLSVEHGGDMDISPCAEAQAGIAYLRGLLAS